MRVSSSPNSQSTEVAGTQQSKLAAAAKKKEKGEETSATSASIDPSSVKADISAKGKEFAKAKAIAKDAPDVREAKIAELKKRIADGKYNVNPEAIADKMVDEHLKTSDI